MDNLKCAACGTVLASEGAFTANLGERAHVMDWNGSSPRILATCRLCGHEGEPVPFESSRRTEKTPEIVESRVAGFRSWKVNEGKQLTALRRGTVWSPGDNRASCPTHGSQAPVVGCKCGFNAFYRFDEWEGQEGGVGDPYAYFGERWNAVTTVCGIASASGRTILHETGWHAEKARVEALIAYRPDLPALGGHVSVRPLLEAIAKTYSVPVISPEEAEMFCSVEGLDLMEPMVGAESEVEDLAPEINGWNIYSSGEIPSGWSHHSSPLYATYIIPQHNPPQASAHPNDPMRKTFTEAVEAKKSKGRFYDGLDTKKGLDQPNKG